jgi:uracil-DNA glycosylase family 4
VSDPVIDLSAFNEGREAEAGYHSAPWYPDLLACTRCPVRAEAKRVVPGVGPLTARILILGRNPGKDEDKNGLPFIGKAGQELDSWLDLLGISRYKVLVTNLVKCHTEKDRPPKTDEIATCATTWLAQELALYPQVQVILTCGLEAARYVLGIHAISPANFEPYAKLVSFEADPTRVLHVIPLVHPSYLLRSRSKRPQHVQRVLPRVKDYLIRELPEAYERSRP